MRASALPLAFVLVILYQATCSDANEQVVKLGGVRDVTATVSATDDAYHVVVEMLPVKAFDAATNRRLNLAKARGFALQALAKYVKAGKIGHFTVRGVEIEKSGTVGSAYRLSVTVPRDGVSLGRSGEAKPTSPSTKKTTPPRKPRPRKTSVPAEQDESRVAVDSLAADFLNAKSDYLDTIARLEAALCDDAVAGEKRATDGDTFYAAISDLEERAEAAFKSLGSQIDADKLLLGVEREEIRPALETARGEVLKALKAAVAQFDQRQQKPKVKKEKKK